MKKIIYSISFLLIAGFSISFTGCSQDKNEELGSLPNSNQLSSKLISPNGDTLFSDLATLRTSSLSILTTLYDTNADKCEITDIQYLPVQDGFAASIEYTTPDKAKANYIMTNAPFEYQGGNLLLDNSNLESRLKSNLSETVTVKASIIVPQNSKHINYKYENGITTYSANSDAIIKYEIKQ